MHHFANKFNNLINIILLNIWTFFAMVLPVLYFFPLISYQQILGIILSGIFVIFYPLVLFLHLINYGDLLNFILDEFFIMELISISHFGFL